VEAVDVGKTRHRLRFRRERLPSPFPQMADGHRRRPRQFQVPRFHNYKLPTTLFPIADQETNDLEKAIAYCAECGWKTPVIVGATGRREDHTLGNVFRGLEHGLEIVTDHGRFLPLCGKLTLRLKKGTPVSLFAPDPATRMTSKGLEWPLDAVRFKNLYCATLNRTTSSVVRLSSTRRAYVYVER